MSIGFDPGYATEPFRSLCRDYPGKDVYPPSDFRVEWGPVFHRGRLDGSARVLLIGQDPATAETIVRRILVGPAGQRVQGLLARLGIHKSYVLVNTFLYSVYGQSGGERHRSDAAIAQYREAWFAALLTEKVEAVVALGGLADTAWKAYRARVGGAAAAVAYVHLRHPTWPESSSGRDGTALAAATKALLADWNQGLDALAPAIRHPDEVVPLRKYGTSWSQGDLVAIPPEDLPPGLPAWMRSLATWATRTGASTAEKRATLTVKVPADSLPAASVSRATAAGRALLAGALRRYGLRGRVVTMDGGNPLTDAVVWIDAGVIAAIQKQGEAVPAAFAGLAPVDTVGVIYPGFMDLHNHLAYNLLSLWQVPAAYDNRDDWKDEPGYDQLVKRPMSLLRLQPGALAAICRYAECKALFGGVTTTQGIRLAKANTIRSYFRGLVRNVEMPDVSSLPRGESRMGDVVARDLEAFWKSLQGYDRRGAAFLLHLSEGYDTASRGHFEALRRADGSWAIDRALAGIHCVALTAKDFAVLAAQGGSLVWSPFSNLLLYGRTADVSAAKAAGLRIGLGCDWSPSGSKNILEELKIAWLYSQANGRPFAAKALVEMVTRVPAEIVRWEARLGGIAPGKLADLTILAARRSNVFDNAVRATEADVRLVVIGGVARYGHPDLMHALVTPDRDVEDLLVAGEARTIDLETDDPGVSRMRFTEAQALLADLLARLPELEKRPVPAAALDGWTLSLDEIEPTGEVMQAAFPGRAVPGKRSKPVKAAPKKKLPTVAVALDPATVAEDAGYWSALATQKNLPAYVKRGLPPLYGAPVPAAKRRARGGTRRHRTR